MKEVVLIVAFDGYQQTEYHDTKKTLIDAGIHVNIASSKRGAAVAKDGSSCQIDLTIDQINPTKVDGVFIIGGPGALDDLNNMKMHQILQKIYAAHVPCGAICISTRILAYSGILNGKQATGWNEDGKLEDLYKEHNIVYVPSPVVIDDLIITAEGPHCAKEFGKAIIQVLKKN